MADIEVKRVPLDTVHDALGGVMVPFGGYRMPKWYESGGNRPEHQAVRNAVGLFDVSHMGRVEFIGMDTLDFVNYITVNNAANLTPGRAQYSAMCNMDGGVIDDVLVYMTRDPDHMSMVINAGNRDKDLAHINKEAENFHVRVADISNGTVLYAVQGPEAVKVLSQHTSLELDNLNPFDFAVGTIDGVPAKISRTGYTGEDGFEVQVSKNKAVEIWNKLLKSVKENGGLPCGLAARDSLRLEAGLWLYGHELRDDISPLEAGMRFILKNMKPEDPDFIGKEALVRMDKEGINRRLVGIRMLEKGPAPRPGSEIVIDGMVLGTTVSGLPSPTLGNIGIGTGYIPPEYAVSGKEVGIKVVKPDGKVREETSPAELLVPPRFLKRKAPA